MIDTEKKAHATCTFARVMKRALLRRRAGNQETLEFFLGLACEERPLEAGISV